VREEDAHGLGAGDEGAWLAAVENGGDGLRKREISGGDAEIFRFLIWVSAIEF